MNNRIENLLYLFSMWLCLVCTFTLLVNDLWRGLGIASSLALYFILAGKQKESNYKLQRDYIKEMERANAKSTKTKG